MPDLTPDTKTPSDIGDSKYSVIGTMTQKSRAMFAMVVGRSKRGLWTSYDDCLDVGMVAPSSEMRRILKACEDSGAVIVKFKYMGRKIWFCV
jgi:hypothetical protein